MRTPPISIYKILGWRQALAISTNTHCLSGENPLKAGWYGCDLINLNYRAWLMTIPFGPPEPSDVLLNKSVSSTRLRAWLNTRLRQLAVGQRIQDARALRSEFLAE